LYNEAPCESGPAAEKLADLEAAHPTEPRLKVCVLAACPFPANHGTPGSIRELAEATAERGHEVHVVSYHVGDDLPLRGVHHHRIPDWTGERGVVVGPTRYRPLYDFQMVFTALKVIRKYKLDLIHAHGYEASLVAGCCRPLVRRPVLYSAHNRMSDELASYDFFISKKLADGLAWLLDRTVPRIGDRCLPHSVNLQQFLVERGLGGRSEPVLNFGIDVEAVPTADRRKLREEIGLGDAPVVFYSGVIDQFQRLDLLLGAMVHVIRRIPRAKLLIMASIPHAKHQAALLEEAARLGVARNLVLQFPVDMERGLKLISLADVAVVPRPAAPGFPIKLLNYMAAARPCVMFASSASRVSHGEHVWLAANDTSESLGAALVRVLRDPSLQLRIGEGGRQFVQARHDRRVVAEQLCRAYLRLVEGTRRWDEITKRPSVGHPSQFRALTSAKSTSRIDFQEVGIDLPA
jgi:glycosyltransferase involved in cell wall biosynthesis